MQNSIKKALFISLTSAAHLLFGLMLIHLFIRHYLFHEVGVFNDLSLGFMALLWGFVTFMSKLDQRQYDKEEAAILRRHEVTRQLYDRWCAPESYKSRVEAWNPLADMAANAQETRYSQLSADMREKIGQINHFIADFYVLWQSGMINQEFAKNYFSTALPAWARLYASTISEFDTYDKRHPVLSSEKWQHSYLFPSLKLMLSWDETLHAYAAAQGKPLGALLGTYAQMRETVKAAYSAPVAKE